ncbi:SulP family inorganic anion transporter [Pokkaliibacter sp. CJK22405]|uniref:SulP family inorganic anion transporter n=1 Tax=Pokkaliibacter sp. CJK22405 TaxID=3384615 RepID=UPI003984DC2B
MLATLTRGSQRAGFDLLAGIALAITMVPEAMTLAFAAGFAPLTGLYTAIMMLVVVSLLGGRPAMAAMTTPALVVVVAHLGANYGLRYVFTCLMLMGLFQLIAWGLKLGKFIRMLPQPVILGSICGLAIEIFRQQLNLFRNPDNLSHWLTGEPLFTLMGVVLATLLILRYLPFYLPKVPAALFALVVVSGVLYLIGMDVTTLGDVTAWTGSVPRLKVPELPLDTESLSIVLPYALLLAITGLSESLFVLNMTDDMTNTRGRSNQECLAQGIGNLISSCFGGLPASGHFGQTLLNLQSGGRSRFSTLTAAVLLILIVIRGEAWLSYIPLGVVLGIMLMVAFTAFESSLIRLIRKVPRTEQLVALLVMLMTLFFDLALAMAAGVVVSALGFAWEHAKHVRVLTHDEGDARVYVLHGPLFFGSARSFQSLFHPATDPMRIVLDFRYSRVYDHSGLEAIEHLVERYEQAGKQLHLRHLSTKCKTLLNKKAQSLVEVNLIEDPYYQVASDHN